MSYDFFGPHFITDISGEVPTTQRLCPLQPFQILDADASGNESIICTKCVKNLCQFWSPILDNSSDIFQTIDAIISPFSTQSNIDEGRCSLQTGDHIELLYKLTYHMHNSHMHENLHNDPYISEPAPDNSPTVSSGISGLASLLIQEYLNNEDLNLDGKIYNYDFEIYEDAAKPPILISIDNNKPDRSDVLIPWQQYLQGKIPAQILNVYPNYGNDNGNFYIKLSGHFFIDDSSLPGDFQVYVDGNLLPDNEYLIADEATLFIKIVAGSYPDDTIDFAIQNRGDTFETGINTGGYLRTFERVFTFGPADTDSEAQDEIEEQIRDANGGNLF